MPEPITEVWGVFNRERELVMLKAYDCTDNGWPDGYTVERLPLSTKEMVADKERLDWLEALLTAESRIEITHHRVDGNKDLGHFASIVKLLDIEDRIGDDTYGFGPGVRAALDAARAATTEGASDDHPGGARD